MPTKIYYKILEIKSSLDYSSYIDQQWQSSYEVIEQLEIVKREVEDLILNIKEDYVK